jgi:A/G-specific adenine glycosylase
MQRLVSYARRCGLRIETLLVGEDLSKLPVAGPYTSAVYLSLLLPEVLRETQRILYLDVDLIVTRDVSELFDVDLGDRPLAAARDGFISESPHVPSSDDGFPASPRSYGYFNAGVLVINADVWRRERIGRRAIELLRGSVRPPSYLEQDALNTLTAGRWAELDPRWNVLSISDQLGVSEPDRVVGGRTMAEQLRLEREAFILHFAGPRKPWHAGYPRTPNWDVYEQFAERRRSRPASRSTPLDRGREVLNWAVQAGRDLPWRRTRDPWAVLVSELMLQQTQVSRVVPKYEAFLARFRNPAACAGAPVAETVRLWAGLGYNRRALNLHRAACVIVERHGGRLPDSLAELVALPGVGPYTARAVLAFAFGRDVGVLDSNAARVLARSVTQRPITQGEADELVPAGLGWAWNQAVIDLGALVCRPRPRCEACPLAVGGCAWHAAGRPAPDPWRAGPRQSRFEGSDRQGRGRLVDALRRGPVSVGQVADAAGWPDDPERAWRVTERLVAEGFATRRDGQVSLDG